MKLLLFMLPIGLSRAIRARRRCRATRPSILVVEQLVVEQLAVEQLAVGSGGELWLSLR